MLLHKAGATAPPGAQATCSRSSLQSRLRFPAIARWLAARWAKQAGGGQAAAYAADHATSLCPHRGRSRSLSCKARLIRRLLLPEHRPAARPLPPLMDSMAGSKIDCDARLSRRRSVRGGGQRRRFPLLSACCGVSWCQPFLRCVP